MQKKTIQKTIKAKMEDWLASIKDATLRSKVKKHLLVSGGSIASMFLNEEVNDFDVYIQDRETLISLVKYYIHGHPLSILDGSKKIEYIESAEDFEVLPDVRKRDMGDPELSQFARAVRNLKINQVRIFTKNLAGGLKVNEKSKKLYVPKFFSPNAISLSGKIQLVCRFHGTPEEIHKTFDFIHATNYFTMNDGLVTNIEAVESLLTKQLKYQGSYYPVTSIIRTKKFIKRKWNIGAGELLKIMFQISELNLKDVDVLEEQLIGVDVAYFGLLINALQSSKSDITSSYLGTLIDKIFNDDDTPNQEMPEDTDEVE